MTATTPCPITVSAAPSDVVVDISPCGDAAVRVTVGGADENSVWSRVHRLARVLNEGAVRGVLSAVPTYDAILVEFDLHRASAVEVTNGVRAADAELAPDARSESASRLLVVPTAFGGRHGPDLEWVAETVGMSANQVIDVFCAEDHLVRCLGGPAASAMMDGPALGRPVPRLSNPRLRVPPGAVSLAGRQAVLGPVAAPSGWRQIGCTPLRVLSLTACDIVPYAPGDRMRFVPVDEATFVSLSGEPLTGGPDV